MALNPGETLGPYEIVSLLGAGGMGEVYLAREVSLGRRVALKVLPPEFAHDVHRIARFEQEARRASALSHPNICTIFALGEVPDGRRFIAMEYIEGQTLRQRITVERLSLREVLDISSQIAAGVSAAHTLAIVHRDLKPENVLIRPDRLVKVVDFGLAKLALTGQQARDGTTHLGATTDPGSAVGTIAYMSPEQARAQEVDARTDIWSLGVLMYEMVAGRSPFAGESSSDVLAAILDREPAPLARFAPEVPVELQRLVSKALRKDREQRYQVMKDLLLDLQALGDDVASQTRSSHVEQPARPESSPTVPSTPAAAGGRSQSSAEYIVRQLGRHKVPAALVVCVLALLVGTTWWKVRNRQAGAEVVRSTAPAQRDLKRLTFGPGLQTDVTWSPDGRFIAYAADRSGSFDVWVQSVAGGEPVQVTKSAAHETQPDWSPDSSIIAYRSEADGGGIHVVPALGGAERRLVAGGYRPRFSPDGSQVMYLSSLGHETTNVARPDVYLVASEGGAPRRLFGHFWDQVHMFQSIGWHPDGRRLSFTGRILNRSEGFFTVPLTDGLPIASPVHEQVAQRLEIAGPISARRTAASTRVELQEFRWSPSGTRLFFAGSLNGLQNLWSVEVDPATLAWRSGPDQLTSGSGSDVRLALSADGRRIAFTMRSEATRVWVIPFDDRRGRTSGDGEPVSPSDFTLENFNLSRDGKKLAFVGVLPGARRTQLWEVTLDTGERTLRFSDTTYRGLLRYSRSADALAYWVERAPGTIRMIRSSAVEEQIVTQSEMSFPFDWTPDGTAIIGSSTTDIAKPWHVAAWQLSAAPHAENSVTVVLRDAELGLWGARYSPNGRWLCFNAHGAKGNSVVGVASASGPSDRPWSRVTDGQDWADKPRWSPDGRMLYYISSAEEGIYNLHRIGFDPETGRIVGAPIQITSFQSPARTISPNLGLGELGVAPGRLALTILEASGSIWMIDNVDR